jgi:hypothetical protein
MGTLRSLGSAVVLGALPCLASFAPWATAQSDADRPRKSVYGTLESVDSKLNGVIMNSDAGDRLAWRFPAAVVAEVGRFKAGAPMIVIYRQTTPNDKRVTAVAFPGAAQSAVYVNLTGSRILLRSAPAVGGVCGQPDAGPIVDATIPAGGTGEAPGECWCCADAARSCTPSSKTGLGKAFLVSCFE